MKTGHHCTGVMEPLGKVEKYFLEIVGPYKIFIASIAPAVDIHVF